MFSIRLSYQPSAAWHCSASYRTMSVGQNSRLKWHCIWSQVKPLRSVD